MMSLEEHFKEQWDNPPAPFNPLATPEMKALHERLDKDYEAYCQEEDDGGFTRTREERMAWRKARYEELKKEFI
jgi:hypothetical protein